MRLAPSARISYAEPPVVARALLPAVPRLPVCGPVPGIDFSKAKRGPVMPVYKGKTGITIRLDEDVITWFRTRVEKAGGGNYHLDPAHLSPT